jgi:hypothetical protein
VVDHRKRRRSWSICVSW